MNIKFILSFLQLPYVAPVNDLVGYLDKVSYVASYKFEASWENTDTFVY